MHDKTEPNQNQVEQNCHPYNNTRTRIRSRYISHERQFGWWDEQNQRAIMWKQNFWKVFLQVRSTPVYILQQVTAEVQPRLAAQANGDVSLDRTRLVNITSHPIIGKSVFRSLYELLCISHEKFLAEKFARNSEIIGGVTSKHPWINQFVFNRLLYLHDDIIRSMDYKRSLG